MRRSPATHPDPLLRLGIPLNPRKPHPPQVLTLPPGKQHRITVKFSDEIQARMTGDRQIAVSGGTDQDLAALAQLAQNQPLHIEPVFQDAEGVEDLRIRAATQSGQMQADLNGTMQLQIPPGSDVLHVARTLQSMALIESVEIESLDAPPPPPSDISPTTPSLLSYQGYRNTNPGFGVDWLWNLGITGQGVRITDCEYGYNPNHEDLVGSGIQNDSTAAINSAVYTNNWDEHGTATMGIFSAGHNGYGVSGIAPNSQAHFVSEWTTLGYNRNQAVQIAVTASSAGDIVLLEMQASGPLAGDDDYVPAEYQSTLWNLTKTATDAGIIVVAAAGNGNQNLDGTDYTAYMARGDSGALIIGAGSNTTAHSRLSFSTYGSRVNVQAWGTSVATAGYGSFAKYGNDDNQTYTTGFNGTSSASACAAGVAALLQSYSKTVLQTTLTPLEMRAHFRNFGHSQTGTTGSIGPAMALNLAIPALPDRPMTLRLDPNSTTGILLTFWGLPFRNYKIEASPNLSTWSNLQTNIPGSADNVQILLQNEIPAQTRRFYRIKPQ